MARKNFHRNKSVSTSLSEEEREILQTRADIAGANLSEYIRLALFPNTECRTPTEKRRKKTVENLQAIALAKAKKNIEEKY